MTATTGCLILAVVVIAIAILWRRDRNAVLRELHSILGYTANEHTPLIAARIAARWYRELAECRVKEKRESTSELNGLQKQLDSTAEMCTALMRQIDDNHTEIRTKDADLACLREAVNVAIARADTTAHHNGDLQTKIATLEDQVSTLLFKNADLELELAKYRKPPEVQAAEHDNVGASVCDPHGNGWCGCDVRVPPNSDLSISVYKPPRVRDDEAND